MEKYNSREIEKKWQQRWSKQSELSEAQESSGKSKFYCLDMFPYPSAAGLHVGHVENYTATDIYSRFKRLNGYNVIHPIGWDAFGLPAENFAIKSGTHPDETTHNNIKNFTKQIQSLGMSYDWSREIDTSKPEYYKWTQWFFLFLYKNGLAYKKKAKVNWCNSCMTVLANEQVVDGACERCKNQVVQKDLEQWFFKITDFIEDQKAENGELVKGLINGLDGIDWPSSTKLAQKNWIGKSEGSVVKFKIKDNDKSVEVFTTRVDTIFGVTYVVLSPEHKLVQELKDSVLNWSEVENYLNEAKKKTDLERMEAKEKTGVALKGISVINPFNDEEVPLFVGDYVLSQYGTGAVMAVPAHDERDFEFAKKYNLPIKAVIAIDDANDIKTKEIIDIAKEIAIFAKEKNKIAVFDGGLGLDIAYGKITRNHGDIDLQVEKEEIENWKEYFKENGFNIESNPDQRFELFVATRESLHIDFGCYIDDTEKLLKNTMDDVEFLTFTPGDIIVYKKSETKRTGIVRRKDYHDFALFGEAAFTEDGFLIDSGSYSGLSSEDAREKMATWLEKEKLGTRKINYRLRDWLVSRQRYWGAPIPIIYCDKCGEVPVPEKDLPVLLPTDVDFKPTGESPLVNSKTFHDVACPKCGAKAKRESDTMDTFVCSSWYYLRFADPKNQEEFASKEKLEKWLPVDLYMGGAEHTVLHLLYARFFTKALKKYGYVNFDEPFLKLRHQGMIMAEDGRKMSKSLGNVVNPDDVVAEFGADALRLYEMFMGPLEETKAWNTNNIIGLSRFLEKVWKIQSSVISYKSSNKKLQSLLHKTIKKVTGDIEEFRFNTAISSLMILVNAMEKEDVSIDDYKLMLVLIAPFAPHLAEELWEKIGNNESIFLQGWPTFDEGLAKDEEIEMVVQVNGRVRDRLIVAADVTEDEAKETALESEKIKIFTEGKEIKKIIFVQGKLINIVVA